MALIASLFALVGRFVGRVLTTTLGWASILVRASEICNPPARQSRHAGDGSSAD